MLADIVLLDWAAVTHPWQEPSVPLEEVVVRRARTGAVETVMIGGAVVLHVGRFVRLDRAAKFDRIAQAMRRPNTPAEAARRRLTVDALPAVRRCYAGWLR